MPRSGSREDRGYDYSHRQLREWWSTKIKAGEVVLCHARICLEEQRRITPPMPWDLGHTEGRTAWTGPEHRRCNRSEGATRGNKIPPRRRWKL